MDVREEGNNGCPLHVLPRRSDRGLGSWTLSRWPQEGTARLELEYRSVQKKDRRCDQHGEERERESERGRGGEEGNVSRLCATS